MESDLSEIFRVGSDPRILELAQAFSALRSGQSVSGEFNQNPWLTRAVEYLHTNGNSPMSLGYIRSAIPYYNWYNVQMEAGQGFQYCCQLSMTGLNPSGMRSVAPLPVGSRVLVMQLPAMAYGIILGVVPSLSAAVNSNYMPDKLCYGSGTGFMVDGAYSAFIKYLANQGNVTDFSCGRPLDATGSGEFGYLSETGIGLFMDSYQAYLRVNETCGLFLNYFDSYTRLAGWNMDWQTVGNERQIRDDEGEVVDFEGLAVYPWESIGSLTPSSGMLMLNTDDQAIQYGGLISKLEPVFPDLLPFYRYQKFGGYLGQGHRRSLIVPGRASGVQRYQDKATNDRGVFEEKIGLDGAYSLRSAHSFSFVKRVNIPVPKRIRSPEDQQETSDNGTNYKASGQFGSGPEHKVGNLPITGGPSPEPLFAAATTEDFRAYDLNWKALHPYHYHKGDFELPQESDSGWKNQAKLDFSQLTGASALASLPLPSSQKLRVDARYGDTEYFESESYLHALPDGGVVLGDGYGAELVMTGGDIYLTCPGNIYMMPGKNLVQWAGDDCVVRARNSIDISATNKDVRIKAQQNLQVLGQGILIESTGLSAAQKFVGQTGEDVQASGILLKSKSAPLAVWTAGVYVSTGIGDVQGGDIVFDAAQGLNSVQLHAMNFDRYLSGVSRDIFGSDGRIQQVNIFASTAAIICTPLTINGTMAVLNSGGLTVDGNIDANGIVSGKQEQIGQLKGKYLQDTVNSIQADSQIVSTVVKAGKQAWTVFSDQYYQSGELGDNELIPEIGFSYRDNGSQYGSSAFVLVESRWQRMVRAGNASGGSAWQETPVIYQGNNLYPFPGSAAFGTSSQALLSPAASTLNKAGVAVDRTNSDSNPYTSSNGLPASGSWQKFSLNDFSSLG